MRNKTIIIVLIVVVSILIIALGGAIVYVVMQRNQDTTNTTKVMNNAVVDEENETSDDENTIPNNENDVEQQTFNAMFETYEGTNVSASTVRGLYSLIVSSNETNTDHQVTIVDSGITDITQLDAEKKYTVKLSKDTEGYVNSVQISESIDGTGLQVPGLQAPGTENDLEKAVFNTKFISYYGNGEIAGADIMKLINEVVASNEANPNHQVDVQTNTLTNPSDIVETEKYSIALEYDANGWVSIIKVEKKY